MGSNDEAQARRQVLYELWISFAALIRSYAAALAMAAPGSEFEVADRGACGLQIENASKKLDLELDKAGGSGCWSLTEGARSDTGEFRMDEDGRVSLDGNGPMEMDAAAEILTAKIL